MPRHRPLLPPAVQHLGDRFTYGVTPELAAEMGNPPAWFRAQLARSQPEDPRALLTEAWFPRLLDPPALTALLESRGLRSANQVGTDLIARTFARRVLSRHQVYETMVDFWSNLLYVPGNHDRAFPWRADLDDLVRRHALGRYRDLLLAVTVHPAMAGFLDNDLNRRGGLNENLGRELLELHTVGNVYRERDVRDSARLLTGYTVDVTTTFAAGYDPRRHATGSVRVLGFTHRNRDPDGRAALRAYLRYLAMHPATARRIAERLCVRFVSDDPPRSVVDDVARTYLRSGSDIGACLTTLASHPAFGRARGEKVRTPSDDVVHTARVLGLRPSGALTTHSFVYRLVDQAQEMGMVSLRWPAPDGWPEHTAGYLSASRVLRSWQTHLQLAATRGLPLVDVDVAPKSSQLPQTWPQTLADVVDHQSRRIVGRPATREMVRAVALACDLRADHRLTGPGSLSDYQYQLMRGTILNSPAGLQR